MAEVKWENTTALSSKLEAPSSWRLLPELYGCLFIDMSWIDMVYGLSHVLSWNHNHEEIQSDIETCLGGPDRILISLSVRSSFDLFLQAMNFPPGSELISTCINIQQMSDIAKYHRVFIKAVDIDLSNLMPSLEQIETLINDKTVGVMVVQLFGMKFRNTKLKQITEKHNLLLIEDCAQAFYGPQSLNEVQSDIAFFSFGSIKRFTCLGGACIVCNKPFILQKMRQIQRNYPLQGRYEYFCKLSKYAIFMFVINNTVLAKILSSFLSMIGVDYKVFVKSRLRSFTRGNLIKIIRHQPSVALLLLLRRRMKHLLNKETCMKGSLRAEYALGCLIEQPTYIVGCLSEIRDFWLFPVLVDNPIEVEHELNKYGVSAFSKASSLQFNHKPSSHLKASKFLCSHILYLPIDRRVPKWHIDHVCKSFMTVLHDRKSIFEIADQEGVHLKRDLDTLLMHASGPLFSSDG